MKIKKCFYVFLLSILPLTAAPMMQPGLDFSLNESGGENIAINNRILIKVNGHPISVLDVVKKMDLLFYRQYPQYATSPMARYQFYLSSWRMILQTVIDDHLILADAEEKEIEISDGDVREELEEIFGPDVVINIDKIGLTYEEAWGLLKKELTVQRMTGMMIRSRAMNEVSPKAIREKYEEFVKLNPSEELWLYRVFSVRGTDEEKVKQVADEAYRLVSSSQLPIEEAVALLQGKEEGLQIALSEEYQRKNKEISQTHRAVLQAMNAGGISLPIIQLGTKSQEVTARLFFLKDYQAVNPSSFAEMKGKLQSELTQMAMARYSQSYLEKLRIYYGVTEAYVAERIPENFQPFTMR